VAKPSREKNYGIDARDAVAAASPPWRRSPPTVADEGRDKKTATSRWWSSRGFSEEHLHWICAVALTLKMRWARDSRRGESMGDLIVGLVVLLGALVIIR